MPKCTLNGKVVEVPEGTTIIEAFKKADIDIAHYCWHPGLSVAGVCRLCMVKIEGNPKLQIACNTVVTDGMVVSNQDTEVKEAVQWGLDFHLINHPLDCPICDQAGECGLQDQYMQFGKYDPEMAEHKVRKRKVVDLGERVVLDSERCILCARCVRFTDEVTKTNELGIFNRGDRSEVGTFADKPLNNNYSVNTVDICPVGALTSKDFRFKQRVWFLKQTPSVCTGCSTGCNINVFHNKEGVWRIKPRHNPDINGYWMCDEGRNTYKACNLFETIVEGERGQERVRKETVRLTAGRSVRDGMIVDEADPSDLSRQLGRQLRTVPADSVALIVTGQQTTEELNAAVEFFAKDLKSKNVFYWVNNPEKFDEFDGLLNRGDKNPNTKGVLKVLDQHKMTAPWQDLEQGLEQGRIQTVVVVGPEQQAAYPDFAEKVVLLQKAKTVIWATADVHPALDAFPGEMYQIPLRTFIEKSGTFINFQGTEQKISPVTVIVEDSLTVDEMFGLFRGQELSPDRPKQETDTRVQNEFVHIRGAL